MASDPYLAASLRRAICLTPIAIPFVRSCYEYPDVLRYLSDRPCSLPSRCVPTLHVKDGRALPLRDWKSLRPLSRASTASRRERKFGYSPGSTKRTALFSTFTRH